MKDDIPLIDNKSEKKRNSQQEHAYDDNKRFSLTVIMQRILAYPIESKSLFENMVFLADVKRQLAELI